MGKVLTIWFLTLSWFTIHSQSLERSSKDFFQLSGRVVDTAGNALPYATVEYARKNDTSKTITNENGYFTFRNRRIGKFWLFVTMKGYLTYSRSFDIEEIRASIPLVEITLRTNYNELDPVTVLRVRPVSIVQDTVSFHVAAFPVPDGSQVEDILKRLPGIEVDMNGNVFVQGKRIEHVLVNGKEFFGGDVVLAIQNLPANVVDKLQIIDDYGDKARLTGVRSGDVAKVLNIVLRSDRRTGAFGQLNAIEGTRSMYDINAFANAFSGDRQISARGGFSNDNPTGSDLTKTAGFSFANRWGSLWEGSFSLNANSSLPQTVTETSIYTHLPEDTLQQLQTNEVHAQSVAKAMTGRVTYTPDHQSMLRLSISANLSTNDNQQNVPFVTAEQDSAFVKTSTGQNILHSTTQAQTFSGDVYFEHTTPTSRRRFSLDGSVHYTASGSNSDNLGTAQVTFDGVTGPSFSRDLIANTANSWDCHLGGTYFFPAGKTSFIEAGYQWLSSSSPVRITTFSSDSAAFPPTLIDSLSQYSVERTFSQKLHLGVTGKRGNLDVSSSLDAQPGELQGAADAKGDMISYHYFSLLPRMEASYNLVPARRLTFIYNGSSGLPSIQQLSPFTNLSNPQYPISGNPHLREAFHQKASLGYEQGLPKSIKYFGFGGDLSYAVTLHSIVKNIVIPQNSSQVIQESTYANAGKTTSLSLDVHAFLPYVIHNHFRVTVYGTLSKLSTITMTDSVANPTVTLNFTPSVHLQYYVPNVIETDLSVNYSLSSTRYPGVSSGSTVTPTAALVLDSRLYGGRKWIIHPQLYQIYTSSGAHLNTVPASLNTILERKIGQKNNIIIMLSGLNLLGQHQVSGETVTPTTITQTTPQLTGRLFLLQFQWRFQKFKQ